MPEGTFEIESSPSHRSWAEVDNGDVLIHRTSVVDGAEHVVSLHPETLRNLLTWAARDDAVVAHFTGPMGKLVRDHSVELGMTPEMFVWHAVKVFIEVGAVG
jgi:hypothetical protein